MIIRVIPDYTLTNASLINLLSNMCRYKRLDERLSINVNFKNIKESSVTLEKQTKICFEILLQKDKVEFYYICKDDLVDVLLTELKVVYPKATFKGSVYNGISDLEIETGVVDDPMPNIKGVLELGLEKHSFLSIKTDMRSEQPLTSILETRNVLKNDEAVLIQYVIVPEEESIKSEFASCVQEYKTTKKIKNKSMLDSRTIVEGVAKGAYAIITELLDTFSLLFTNQPFPKEDLDKIKQSEFVSKGLSPQTFDKVNMRCYNTTIRIGVETKEKKSV